MYNNLRDYLALPDNDKVKQGLLTFLQDYSTEETSEELWECTKEIHLGLTKPHLTGMKGRDHYWHYRLDFDDNYLVAERLWYDPQDGEKVEDTYAVIAHFSNPDHPPYVQDKIKLIGDGEDNKRIKDTFLSIANTFFHYISINYG